MHHNEPVLNDKWAKASFKQKKFVLYYLASANRKDAAEKAGYTNVGSTYHTEVRELLTAAISAYGASPDAIDRKAFELLHAEQTHFLRTPDGSYDTRLTPDYATQMKAVERFDRLHGRAKAPTVEVSLSVEERNEIRRVVMAAKVSG